MNKPVSICIPAHNEEETIGTTIDSIVSQSYENICNILICANGCSDNTTEVVREYCAKYPSIELTVTTEIGKPNAWNILRDRARTNHLFFADGDVVLDKNAIKNLQIAMETSGKISIGATVIPITNNNDLVTKMIFAKPSFQSSLWGALYGINNEKLTQRMISKGFTGMPKEIIADDAWLSLVIGKNNWEIEESAVVFYVPPSINDLRRSIERRMIALKQLRKYFRELDWKKKEKEERFSFTYFLGQICYGLLEKKCKKNYATEINNPSAFLAETRSQSSKKKILIPVQFLEQ